MKEVFLLVGKTSYENDDIICVYLDKAKAEKEAKRLNQLLSKYPKCPEQDASDVDWDKYDSELEKWKSRYKHSWCDQFDVITLKVKP